MQKEKEYNRRRGGSAASLLYEKVGENPAFFAVYVTLWHRPQAGYRKMRIKESIYELQI